MTEPKCKLCARTFEKQRETQVYCTVRCQVRQYRRNASGLQRSRYAALKAAGVSVQVANIASKSSGKFERALAEAQSGEEQHGSAAAE